ncbi:uncharacterized protein [Rutidosis leptorrhynchoides]|uniref:uncharacterized protein n=1 Tax=Rutidosis leptorrhynchoides TaxID=125765 RepID=UPI003A993733
MSYYKLTTKATKTISSSIAARGCGEFTAKSLEMKAVYSSEFFGTCWILLLVHQRLFKGHSTITHLLGKDVPFNFTKECTQAFNYLKVQLTHAPIMIAPDWSLPFKIMCDASDFAVGAVLGQRKDKHFHPLYYAIKTLTGAQENYTTTKNSKSKTQNQDFYEGSCFYKNLISRLKTKKEAENVAVDHLSRLENPSMGPFVEQDIIDKFLKEKLMSLGQAKVGSQFTDTPWYADITNFIVARVVKKRMSTSQRWKFFRDVKSYYWEDPYLFKVYLDQVIRRCVDKKQAIRILHQCHHGPTGGHHGANLIVRKVYKASFYWPSIFKDAQELVSMSTSRNDFCKE